MVWVERGLLQADDLAQAGMHTAAVLASAAVERDEKAVDWDTAGCNRVSAAASCPTIQKRRVWHKRRSFEGLAARIHICRDMMTLFAVVKD